MSEAPGPINFTMFLTMFGERLNGTDPEDVIKNAFACFDKDNTGTGVYDVCTGCTIMYKGVQPRLGVRGLCPLGKGAGRGTGYALNSYSKSES